MIKLELKDNIKIKKLWAVPSAKKGIYSGWKWGEIKENIVDIINQDNYGTNISDIGIRQRREVVKLGYNITEVFYTGNFFIVQESSRGSILFIKMIPKKIMPLFDKDIILKAFADGGYGKGYTESKRITREKKEVKYNDGFNSIYKTIKEYDYRIIYNKEEKKVQVFKIKTNDISDKEELYVNDDNLSKIEKFSEKTLILVNEIVSYLGIGKIMGRGKNKVIRKLYGYGYIYKKVLNGENISFYNSQDEKIEKDVKELEKEWNKLDSKEEIYFEDFGKFGQILLNKGKVKIYEVDGWTYLIIDYLIINQDFLNYNYIKNTPFFTVDEKSTNWTCLYNIDGEFIDYVKKGTLKVLKNKNKIRYYTRLSIKKELNFDKINNSKQGQNNK